MINESHYFKYFSFSDSFNRHVVAFFEASVLKEVRILFVISSITVRYYLHDTTQ